MKKFAYLLALIAIVSWTGAQAQSENQDTDENQGHPYIGFGATSLGLDNDRVPGVPTSSPGHSSKIGSLILGYQFDDLWAADVSFGTDMSNNVDTDVFAVNGYRFLGSGSWRPYVSAGASHFSLDDAPDDSTQQLQAGIGLSANLNRNLELRAGYQRYFAVSDESYQDNAIGASLTWHFRKPEATVAQAEPQPESVPEQKEVVETIELQVQFDFDKSTIKSAYEPQFGEIAQALEQNPDKTITIEGHTCWIGTEEYNQGLSERRASAVKQKLVEDYDIAPERLDARGFGESRPVADNSTQAGRERNRRAIAVIMQTRTVTD
ncbi:MAG: OmpA family protein [Gammaproteobacteria bacterium]|nr:OmpA family protein [Gammaproteobacteria bacterium]